jgi:hypothetical protein
MELGIQKLDIDSHFAEENCDRKSRLKKIVEAYETLVKKVPEAKSYAETLEVMKKELEKEKL